jgi:hypothetical protein
MGCGPVFCEKKKFHSRMVRLGGKIAGDESHLAKSAKE